MTRIVHHDSSLLELAQLSDYDRRMYGVLKTVSAIILVLGLFNPHASSADLAKPTGKTILTVGGDIRETNSAKEAHFDHKMLMALGMQTLRTTNPFETGVQNFEGVLLRDVLKYVGAEGSLITAYALDGYAVEIPVKDAMDYPILLAISWNGKEMTVRNKGPLWIVYPVEQCGELKGEQYSARSIWQLGRLVIH